MTELHKVSDKNEIILKKFNRIIDKNSYVKNCISNKSKNKYSISFLIDRKLSQSDSIKIGYGLENILKDFILSENKNLKDITYPKNKNKKQRDHLFIDNNNKIIYYAELKSNLYLDTEKTIATIEKCKSITVELQNEYPEFEIKMFLVNNRYFSKSIIPKLIFKKFYKIQDNIVGINEYLLQLNIELSFKDENHYKKMLNYLVDKMFYSDAKSLSQSDQ
jgi:hypothetical protein